MVGSVINENKAQQKDEGSFSSAIKWISAAVGTLAVASLHSEFKTVCRSAITKQVVIVHLVIIGSAVVFGEEEKPTIDPNLRKTLDDINTSPLHAPAARAPRLTRDGLPYLNHRDFLCD